MILHKLQNFTETGKTKVDFIRNIKKVGTNSKIRRSKTAFSVEPLSYA